jgi:hypothetical protein
MQDTLGQQSDLRFYRTGILFRTAVCFKDICFFCVDGCVSNCIFYSTSQIRSAKVRFFIIIQNIKFGQCRGTSF